MKQIEQYRKDDSQVFGIAVKCRLTLLDRIAKYLDVHPNDLSGAI